METISPLVESKKYLRNLLDKVSRQVVPKCVLQPPSLTCVRSLVLTRFTNSMVRSRPLKENGAEQVNAVDRFLDDGIDITPWSSCLLTYRRLECHF
jgi:hypothetical protein